MTKIVIIMRETNQISNGVRKQVYQTLSIAILLFGFSSVALAAACPAGQICNPLAYGNIEDLVNAVIKFLYNMGLVIAPIMFVVAGILFVTSAGDPERVRTARRVALYTAIGFAVILVASGLGKVLQALLQNKP